MTTLSDYNTQTRRLLHDVSGNFWTDAELNDYINAARVKVVADTGCLRVLQTPIIQQATEVYSFGGLTSVTVTNGGTDYPDSGTISFSGGGGTGAAGTFTASGGIIQTATVTIQGSGYTSEPTAIFSGGSTLTGATVGYINANTLDILSVVVIWGDFRIPLGYMAFTELSAKLRMWTSWLQRPAAFSVFGQQKFYVAPNPDLAYPTEIDSVVTPDLLTDNTTPDTIMYPYTAPVCYYAASLAKIKEQSYSESEMFLQMYRRRALESLSSTFTRRLP